MGFCRLNRQNPIFLSRNPPRFDDQPAAKTKIPTFLQLFCDCGLFSISKKRNRTAVQQITWAFASQSAIGNLQTIPNRKKVALRADFLFLGLRGLLQDGSEADPKGRRCKQGRVGSAPTALSGRACAPAVQDGLGLSREAVRSDIAKAARYNVARKTKARASSLGCPRFVFKRYCAYFRTQVPSGDRIPRPCA